MARQDIMPADSPIGGHCRVLEFPLNASETFVEGEPVSVNADGEVTESADNPAAADIMGIAATGGDTTAGTGTIDFATGNIITTGAMVKVFIPDQNTIFRTRNFTVAGVAFGDTAPAASNIGDEVGLTVIGGSWGLDVAGGTNTCRVIDVLDADGNSVMRSGATGVEVHFQIIAHMSQPNAGVVDAPLA
jgi:hypothetical protein